MDVEEILLLKRELRSLDGGGGLVLDASFLATPGGGVNIKWTTHHIAAVVTLFCLVLLHLTLCRTIFVQIV